MDDYKDAPPPLPGSDQPVTPPLPRSEKPLAPPPPRKNLTAPFMGLVLLLLATGGGVWLFKGGMPSLGGSSSGTYVLAVGTFVDNANTPDHITGVINDVFYSSLDETKKFKLVERNKMGDLYQEYLRAQPAATPDPSFGKVSQGKTLEENERIVAKNMLVKMNEIVMQKGSSGGYAKSNGEITKMGAAGRMNPAELVHIKTLTHADYFLVGVITDFYSEQTTKESDSMGRRNTRSALTITLDARVVNTATGEILVAPTVRIEKPRIQATPNNPLADRMKKLEIDTAREAARQLACNIVNSLYPITVSEIAAGKVYLNRGTGLGVQTGQTYTVFSQGKDIIDPDTQKSIGKVEESVGDIVISEATDKMAIATAVPENPAIKKGMICRLIQAQASNGSQSEASSPATAPPDDGRMAIAIMPLRNSAKADPKLIDDLQTYFYTEMGQYPKVRLIERQQLDQIAKELNLTDDGYVSPATAIKVGELTGAKFCLVGSLVNLSQKASTTALRQDLTMTRNRVAVELDCRILETGKGEVSKTASSSKSNELEKPAEEVASQTMRETVKDACAQLMGVAVAATPSAPAEQPAPAPGTEKVAGAFLVISQFIDGTKTADKNPVAEICKALDTNLEYNISQTKRIPLVERQDDRFLDEMVFGKNGAGFVDPTTIPKTGKLKGAKYYLATKVTRYAQSAGGSNDALPNVYENSWDFDVEILGKLLNIETGEIHEEFLISKHVSGTNENRSRMNSIPADMLSQLNDKLAKETTFELTGRLLEIFFPVQIADVSDADIYLNQGESTGIRPGLKFTVYNVGKDITDPTTGRVIGHRKSRVGTIAVNRVEREMALAAPEQPAKINDFLKGMECQFERQAQPAAERPAGGKSKSPSASSETGSGSQGSQGPASSEANVPAGRVFAVAPIATSADAPNRVEQAIRTEISNSIKDSGAKVVTRDDTELAEIGQEYFRGKSRLMDEATRLKTIKLTGARYMVFLGITDWVSQVEEKTAPMINSTYKIQEVNIALGGRVIDLKTGEVKATGQVTASSPKDRLVTDNHGDLNMDVKVAKQAAQQLSGELRFDEIGR